MSKQLENLTYKEALRLVIKILDEQSNQIKSIDDRERLLQKAMERLLGKQEGKKEESSEWKWKALFTLSVLGFVISIVAVLVH